jgi:hypothetical protein
MNDIPRKTKVVGAAYRHLIVSIGLLAICTRVEAHPAIEDKGNLRVGLHGDLFTFSRINSQSPQISNTQSLKYTYSRNSWSSFSTPIRIRLGYKISRMTEIGIDAARARTSENSQVMTLDEYYNVYESENYYAQVANKITDLGLYAGLRVYSRLRLSADAKIRLGYLKTNQEWLGGSDLHYMQYVSTQDAMLYGQTGIDLKVYPIKHGSVDIGIQAGLGRGQNSLEEQLQTRYTQLFTGMEIGISLWIPVVNEASEGKAKNEEGSK